MGKNNRKSQKAALKHKSNATTKPPRTQAVDVVTGKATVEYFFDPCLVMKNKKSDKVPRTKEDPLFFESKHLYMPCTVVKPLEGEKDHAGQAYPSPALLKTNDGTLHKITDSTKLTALVSPDDYLGCDDVLHLPQISEASLLHTIRTRFQRDDIYTSAGPILISINPYRDIRDHNNQSIYSEQQMMLYRSSDDFYRTKPLPPHLFLTAHRAYTALVQSIHQATAHASQLDMEDPVLLLEQEQMHSPGTLRNQSIIISGESGAGKTEAMKIIMKFLTRIAKLHNHSHRSSSLSSAKPQQEEEGPLVGHSSRPTKHTVSSELEEQVLSSNPLLEAFGNAQTLRNDNSSRFGKFIHIFVSPETGAITGASISNYLLERTRITQQAAGERNYHIFYQLLAAAQSIVGAQLPTEPGPSNETQSQGTPPSHSESSPPHWLQELGLSDLGKDGFRYLCNGVESTQRDKAGFLETVHCLTSLGLSESEQRSVFGIIAALLHLGNVQFVSQDEHHADTARIADHSQASLVKACELMGIDKAKMTEAILTKNLIVDGTLIKKEQNVLMAADKRDALAKLTYSCLFQWLVQRINQTLGAADTLIDGATSNGTVGEAAHSHGSTSSGAARPTIGVLDIYGFECFNNNGFEQLLINYCNEKLQRHFNRHLFEVEQQMYATEGVDWSYITFNDNRPCVELIEGGSGMVGILGALDDAWGSGMGSSSEKDTKFVAQLHKRFGVASQTLRNGKGNDSSPTVAHKNFLTPKIGTDKQFIIQHYAGEVIYTAEGFNDKNMDTLSNELRELGVDASVDLVSSVFTPGSKSPLTATNQRSSIRGVSVSSQFRTSLQSLVDELEQTQPHYIRCIKPNGSKTAGLFMPGEVLKQLRYSGMMEAIRIRREGYAFREDHERFLNRFGLLVSDKDMDGEELSIVRLVKLLSQQLNVTSADWQIGHSKIFLRRTLADKLDRLAKLRVHVAARTITRFGRRVVRKQMAGFLVTWIKFRLYVIRWKRKQQAATTLASCARRRQCQKQYMTVRYGVVKVQALQRAKLATHKVMKIRDPFYDMEFKECKELLLSQQKQLETAVASRNYREAAELETQIERTRQAVESKRPVTRSVIESRILEIQAKLDEAMRKKEFKTCSDLQDRLEELMSKRDELPSVADLRRLIHSIEDEIGVAVKNRDFETAADGQSRLAEAKLRLQECLEADNIDHPPLSEPNCPQPSPNGGSPQPASNQLQLNEPNVFVASPEVSRNISAVATVPLEGKVNKNNSRAEVETRVAGHALPAVSQHTPFLPANKDTGSTGTDNSGKKGRTVSKLRPSKPIIADSRTNIASVASMLSAKRASACIVVGDSGEMVGIITDTDFTRRAVADASINLMTIPISRIMTPKPTCVAMTDPAMDALTRMLENHFRHLPVVNESGAVAGLLDISKCLRDAIAKLESLNAKTSSAAKETIQQVVKGVAKDQADAMHAMLHSLMSMAMGGKTIPTLRSILQGKPSTIVGPSSTVREAGMRMAESKHAALVVDEGRLVGIFGFKDMMSRAIGKQLPLDTTPVSQVMTPDPESISPDMTVIDALYTMADNKFLTLPVIEDDGRVVGLVDVLDVIYASGGADGWRSIFSSALDVDDEASAVSGPSRQDQVATLPTLGDECAPDAMKTVAKLRPAKAILSLTNESILAVAQLLQRKRGDASLVVFPEGALAGIVTDTDFTRRAVAKHLDLAATPVSAIITSDPMCVALDDPAMDALEAMIENHFRHLPVIDHDGAVVGVLDIKKCLHAAIARLERLGSRTGRGSDELLKKLGIDDSANESQVALLQTLLGNLLSQANGGQELPTLAGLLKGKPTTLVSPSTTIRNAGLRMAASRHAALIVEDGKLLGIFGFKDMMSRAIANELDLDATRVSEVMTPEPESVTPDLTVLEALQIMYDQKILTLPVVNHSGVVVGLVDIMDVLFGCGGTAGWRSVFSNAMDLEESGSKSVSRSEIKSQRPETVFASQVPSHIPTTLEFAEDKSFAGSTLGDLGKSGNKLAYQNDDFSRSTTNASVFKVTDPSGNTHRIKCPPSIALLLESISEKANIPQDKIQLQYTDEEGDVVIITGDDDVAEVWELARQSGRVIKLIAKRIDSAKIPLAGLPQEQLLALGIGGALAFLAISVFALSRGRKSG